MKKLGALLFVLTLVLSMFPQKALAAEITSSELELTSLLSELSTSRGFDVSEEDIVLTLVMQGKTMEDFNTVEELKDYLGEVISSDLSNMNDIYNKFSLDQTTLSQVLGEYGEELSDYIFLNDLDAALAFYTESDVFEREADFDTKLLTYLSEVSSERGFPVTVEDINSYLSEYSTSIDDFENVNDLSEYLGDVIKADLSNLDYFITNYEMDENAILQLIEENDKNINDFLFMDQLEELVWSSSEVSYPELDLSMYMDIINQLGITEAEIQKLENHFLSISDYISSTEGQALMGDLSNRMMTFAMTLMEKATANENYKPSDTEITEFASMYEELLSAVKLKVVFSIIKDGVVTQYSIEELMKMDDIKDVDYKVAFYNDKSELLADAVITSDFINSNLGQMIEDVSNEAGVDLNNDVAQTVKGGVLPKTASNYIPKALIGIFIAIIGILFFGKIRTKKNEILKN